MNAYVEGVLHKRGSSVVSVVSPTLTLMTSAILVLEYPPPPVRGLKVSFLWDFVVLCMFYSPML